MKTLILGGVKSGKSGLAEQLALDSGKSVTVIATATALDTEMQGRIARHREQRPAQWQTLEEPVHLTQALQQAVNPSTCVIIDCLTLWMTNLLMLDDDSQLSHETQAFIDVLDAVNGELIMVANETSMGIIPDNALSRRYCDEAGLLHQAVARCSDKVILTVAGLPLYLKGQPH